MSAKKSIFAMFLVLIVVLMMTGTASARPLAEALDTSFTYQGRLTDGGAPASGTYDFQFSLYNALSSGTQVGSTVSKGGLTVTNGLFTVQLDFGNVFDGTALYLQVAVRPGGSSSSYTPLTPLQPLGATPYAQYALQAGSVPWSGITDVPAGVTSGSTYKNVKIVAKSGGDFTTITAALNSIMDASDTNRYLVYVAPGVYTEKVIMKQYVDIQGASELTTKISWTGNSSWDGDSSTLLGADNAELRFVTVENTGNADYAIAIYNTGASPRLTHVTATVSGGTSQNIGIFNSSASSPTMTNITANAMGGNFSIAIQNYQSCSPTMTDIIATASDGTYTYGVNNDASSSPMMMNVNTSASGGMSTYGIVIGSSSPTLMNVSAKASGGTYQNIAILNRSGAPILMNVNASASGGDNGFGLYNSNAASPIINNSSLSASGSTSNYGIYNETLSPSGIYTISVNNSRIIGSTATIYNTDYFTVLVGASQLSGGAITGGGTVTCAGVYDENYTFSASTCP